MKLEISTDACIGCGACIYTSSQNFDYNDEGLATVIDDTITEKTYEAQKDCPVDAIIIKEKGL